jgi:hypothetical protein
LLAQLQADITLPRPTVRTPDRPGAVPWFRRWLPAMGLAGCLFVCAVVLAVQTGTLSQLRRENDLLKQSQDELNQLKAANVEFQKLAAENRELESLRKDRKELQELRGEVARLRGEVAEVVRLKSENQQLLATSTRRLAESNQDFFDRVPDARSNAERIRCVNNLKQVGLAARIWANEHQDVLPPDFLTMKNELGTPKVLHCPSDHARPEVADWSMFGLANASYEMLTPGADEANPEVVYVRCPIHNNVNLVDGSVQQLGKERKMVLRDGKYYIGDPDPASADALRQRYGLPEAAAPTDSVPAATNNADEILRKRYGLPPAKEQ